MVEFGAHTGAVGVDFESRLDLLCSVIHKIVVFDKQLEETNHH